MGYYTNFSLEIKPEQTKERELKIMKAIMAKICDCSPEAIADDEAEYCFYEAYKWYDHNKDMIEISKQFPDILFILDGTGEDHEDIWRTYYHNGKYEETYARIAFPMPKVNWLEKVGL